MGLAEHPPPAPPDHAGIITARNPPEIDETCARKVREICKIFPSAVHSTHLVCFEQYT